MSANEPLETEAYGAKTKGGKIELLKVTLPPLKASQVQIEMSHCGLCHTDVHMLSDDFGMVNFPLVPGHEGVGKVTIAGDDVRGLKVGDRVGVGWIRDSCGTCEMCGCGRENVCQVGYDGTFLGDNNHFGAWSRVMRIEAKFAFKLPDNISAELAGPLMCAGGTVYEPIVEYVKPGTVVGIGAVGGLGTLAIKLCKLHGAKVIAFCASEREKEDVVLQSGADVYVNMQDPKQMENPPKVHVFLETLPVNRELSVVMPLLEKAGIYVRMGFPKKDQREFRYDWLPVIFQSKKVGGSIVTGTQRTRRLLQLASDNLKFVTDMPAGSDARLVPFSESNRAVEELVDQKVKSFRTVFCW
ncbi:hypothetical protein KFE25_013826 [Diacronema lutheri]|uniref:Enoyl reductase (ER) domain-containing protein n=1 Tax=Diacronema lutheri TaxID=2081491 RepID=A0A8J6CIF2_DIALT|nr:hypothetical protein KFE25_013826 [Diacronema lutheri]